MPHWPFDEPWKPREGLYCSRRSCSRWASSSSCSENSAASPPLGSLPAQRSALHSSPTSWSHRHCWCWFLRSTPAEEQWGPPPELGTFRKCPCRTRRTSGLAATALPYRDSRDPCPGSCLLASGTRMSVESPRGEIPRGDSTIAGDEFTAADIMLTCSICVRLQTASCCLRATSSRRRARRLLKEDRNMAAAAANVEVIGRFE